MPGRWAAPPAPAIRTRRPRPAASWPKAIMSRGVRCAETTRTSWATPKRSSISTAPCMHGQVRRAAHHDGHRRDPASGVTGSPRPGSSMPSGTGVPRATAADQARARTDFGIVPAHRHVAQFASRPGVLAIEVHVGALDGQAPGEQLRRVVAGGAAEDVDAGHLGVLGAVEPSGRSSTARRWFSNCEVTAPSIVQWPELWGRVATSLTSSRPLDQNSSTAMTPTAPAISATFWPERRRGLDHVGLQPSRHEHLAAHAVDLRRLDRRPGHRRRPRGGGPPGRPARRRGAAAPRPRPARAPAPGPPRPRRGRRRATRPCRRSRRGPP